MYYSKFYRPAVAIPRQAMAIPCQSSPRAANKALFSSISPKKANVAIYICLV